MKLSPIFIILFGLVNIAFAEDENQDEKNEVKECWAEKIGYPCCPEDNCRVFYVNDNGSWGFENFKWCGIKDTEICKIKNKKCWAEELGYKCCPPNICTATYTDDSGDWAHYNDEWCGIDSEACKA